MKKTFQNLIYGLIITSSMAFNSYGQNYVYSRQFPTPGINPAQLAVAPSGNIYTTNYSLSLYSYNNSGTQIPNSIISGYTGDLEVDNAGNIYDVEYEIRFLRKHNSTFTEIFKTNFPASDPHHYPEGVGIGSDGKIYVLLNQPSKEIVVYNSSGIADGTKFGLGQFSYPTDLEIGPDGKFFILDAGTNSIIIFNSNRTYHSTFPIAVSSNLSAIAIHPTSGEIYVTNPAGDNVLVYNQSGTLLRTIGTAGVGNGEFDFPAGIAFDNCSNLYVSDQNNQRIQIFSNLVSPITSSATNRTPTGFTANWGVSAGATSYVLDVATNSNFDPASMVSGYNNLSVTTNSKIVTGLSNCLTYYYRVRAVNACGGISANSSTIVATAVPTTPTALPITNVNCSGFTANWSAVPSATSYKLDVSTSPSFSSFQNGYQDLTVNSTSQVITGLSGTQYYYYRIRAVNVCGTSASSSTGAHQNPLTTILTNPNNTSPCAQSSFTLTVGATGTNLTYQWKKDGVNIPGATSSTYYKASAVTGDNGPYQCVVTGLCGTQTSGSATVTVREFAQITSQSPTAGSALYCVGTPMTLSVVASGADLTYQWRKGGTNISGATSSTFTIAAPQASDNGAYDCLVQGACGTAAYSGVVNAVVKKAPTSVYGYDNWISGWNPPYGTTLLYTSTDSPDATIVWLKLPYYSSVGSHTAGGYITYDGKAAPTQFYIYAYTPGCGSSVSTIYTAVDNNGYRKMVDENSEPGNFEVNPNPATSFVKVKAPFKEISVKFYNISGVEVLSKAVESDEEISVSELPTGLYTVKISAEGELVTKKINIIK